MKSIYQQIVNNEVKPAVIGLGYVGLPLALELGKKCQTYGFDINHERVELMKKNTDPSKELAESDFENANVLFTAEENDLADAGFYIVAVPTPIDEHRQPDLKPLMSACKTVGKVLSKGDYVVFESTVYPGCTEEDCVPVLEEYSGLTFNEDFKVGFSP
jgi:UDP-N-acetyl-D-galactosamine dehydrogenase